MKVFELSKELNMENKQLIEILNDLKIEVKSHMKKLDDEQIELIKNHLNINENKDNSIQESSTQNTNTNSNNAVESKPNKEKKEKWKPDLNRMICLKNISRGKLIYKSKRQMGYTIEWDEIGSTDYIELGEFMSLKNTDRRFVLEPWVRIVEDDEIEILKFANIFKYYEEILGLKNVSDILNLNHEMYGDLSQDAKFERFKKKFNKLPDGYKNTVIECAANMLQNGQLDSIKIKNYIEEETEVDLDTFSAQLASVKKNSSIDIE